MSSRKVSITEPHPSVPKTGTTYISGGRGGAGNYKRYKTEDITDGPSATGPASRINLLSRSLKKQYLLPVGRGGSGNMYKPTADAEDRVFQFDEEMAKRHEAQAPVYHIGRGGAANWVDERDDAAQPERTRQGSLASAGSDSSESSSGSNVRRTFSSLTRKFS